MQRRTVLTAAALAALASTAPVHAQDATLRFSWWGGGERHETTLKAIAAFEAKNPGVKIKGEYMGFNGYLERLTAQIAHLVGVGGARCVACQPALASFHEVL